MWRDGGMTEVAEEEGGGLNVLSGGGVGGSS